MKSNNDNDANLNDNVEGRKSSICTEHVVRTTRDFYKVMLIIVICLPYWIFRVNVDFWIYQANDMDVHENYFVIHPLVLNAFPAMITIILIPIIYRYVYPMKYFENPLRIFGIAYCLLFCAYICGAFLNVLIERNQTQPLSWEVGQLRIYNGLPFEVRIKCRWMQDTIAPFGLLQMYNISIRSNGENIASTILSNEENKLHLVTNVTVYEYQSVSYIISRRGLMLTKGEDDVHNIPATSTKVILYCANICLTGQITFQHIETDINFTTPTPDILNKATIEMNRIGHYIVHIHGRPVANQTFHSGEINSILLYHSFGNPHIKFNRFILVTKNIVNVLFTIPQCIMVGLADSIGYVSYNLLIFTESPAETRAFSYSITGVLIHFGNLLIVMLDYLVPGRNSTIMFWECVVLFIGMMLYIYVAIKFKLKKY